MRLIELRKQQNITQSDISAYLNTARTTYASYEQNLSKPDIDTLIKLADYYGVTLDYLCDHQTNQLQLPPLDDNQRTLIETILKLNRDNFGIAFGFIMALYQKQTQNASY